MQIELWPADEPALGVANRHHGSQETTCYAPHGAYSATPKRRKSRDGINSTFGGYRGISDTTSRLSRLSIGRHSKPFMFYVA